MKPLPSCFLILIFSFVTMLAACQETPDTVTSTLPPTLPKATNTVMPTQPAADLVTALPTRSIVLTPRSDLLNYASNDNLLAVTFPREWIFTDFRTLFLATNRTFIDNPAFPNDGGLIMIISDQNNDTVRGNALVEGTALDLLNSFILAEELNQFGANFRLLEEIQTELAEGREIARATLSTTTPEGDIGLVFLTALAEEDRRAIVVALAIESTLGRYANAIETITNSLIFIPKSREISRFTPTLAVNEVIQGNWTDGPAAVDIVLQPGAPVLAVLITADDSDGVLVLENPDSVELQQSDFGGPGQLESMRIEVASGERFTLRIQERTRTLGQYQILLVNLARPSPTLQTIEEREVIGLGSAGYVFQPEAGATYLVYVEPIGPDIMLQDATVTVVDALDNLLAAADFAYLSEPEVLLFTMPADVAEFITIRITDYFGQSGLFLLHIHKLIADLAN